MWAYLFLSLSALLVGCEPQVALLSPVPPTLEAPPRAVQKDFYHSLPFSMVFPDSWKGRYWVDRCDNGITVYVDGQATYAVRVVKNKPGAKEKDQELVDLGYTYLLENGEFFIYEKVLSTIPEELYIARNDDIHYNIKEWHTQNTFVSMLRFRESSVCSLALGAPDKKKGYGTYDYDYTRDVGGNLSVYLEMKHETYVNHRLGVSFTIPESMRERCRIICHYDFYLETSINHVYVVYRCDRDNGSWYDYTLCSFDVYTYDGGCYYEAYNQWQDYWHPTAYFQYEWSSYPQEIKEQFTKDEVQQIVDSFTVLTNDTSSG